jgi:hypothetical protein
MTPFGDLVIEVLEGKIRGESSRLKLCGDLS